MRHSELLSVDSLIEDPDLLGSLWLHPFPLCHRIEIRLVHSLVSAD